MSLGFASCAMPHLLGAPARRMNYRPRHLSRRFLALTTHSKAPHVLHQKPQLGQGNVKHRLLLPRRAHPCLINVDERCVIPDGQSALVHLAYQREHLKAAVEANVAGSGGRLGAHAGVHHFHWSKWSQVLQNHLQWGGREETLPPLLYSMHPSGLKATLQSP